MISITLYQPSVIIILEKRGSNMIRLRRLRGSEAIRNMVRENRVNKEDLVYPMFVPAKRTLPPCRMWSKTPGL